VGINIYGSLVIGWDSHNSENIFEDIKRFIQLQPVLYQIEPLCPIPGTQLWKKILKEERLPKDYSYTKSGSVDNFIYKNFTPDQIQNYMLWTLKGLVLENGPWPYRFFQNIYTGYNYLANSKEEILRFRRKGYLKLLTKLLPFVFISYFLFYGKNFRKKIKITLRDFKRQFPYRFVIGLLVACLIIIPFCFIYLYGILEYKIKKYPDQPDYIRKKYNW